ncbi:MAG: oligosaccharide flippase family protein [Clostridia bacterium]|nr:oligosaccharide flippase family protein [Clostridia bacterium]
MIFTAGKFISKLLVFLMMPLYTACLSEAQYSTADLITQLANLLIPLACLGISEGIFRNAAAKEGDKEAFFSSGVAILCISTACFLLLSPLLLLLEYFAPYLWLIVLFVLCSNIHSVCAQYICAIGRTKTFAVQGIVNTVLNIGFNVLFLVGLGMKVEGYVLSVVCADFVTTLALVVYCRLWRAFSFKKISKKLMGEMLKFSLPLIPTTVFWWITGVSDRYLVARMRSDTENGLYAAAYKIPTLLTYMVAVFNEAWRLSAVKESDDPDACADFFGKVFRYYVAIVFVGGAFLIAFAKVCSMLLFADSYYEAWLYVPILVLATVFTSFDSFLATAYFTKKKTMVSFYTSMLGAGLNIVLNLIWIPEWGAVGASVATFVSYFAVFVLRAATMHRYIRFNLQIPKITLNTVLLSGMTVIMMTEPPLWMLWIGILTTAVVALNTPALFAMLRMLPEMLKGRFGR